MIYSGVYLNNAMQASIKALILVLLAILPQFLMAQGFETGNNWIDPSQTYFKMRVSQDGVYRVRASSTPFDGSNVANLRIYYRGEEQVIHVGSADNVFSGNDFVEFVGRRNDGGVDASMYRDPQTGAVNPSSQPNRKHSLFDDTSAYFLTVSNAPRPSNRTYITVSINDFINSPSELGSYPQAQHCRWRARHDFLNAYSNGHGATYEQWYTQNSDYVTGEGRMSGSLGPASSTSRGLQTRYPSNNPNTPPQILSRACTQSSDTTSIQLAGAGGSATFTSLNHPECVDLSYPITQADLSGSLTGTVISLQTTSPKGSSRWAWVEIRYDRNFQFDNETQINFHWDNPFDTDARVQLNGTGAGSSDEVLLFDLANRRRITGLMQGGAAEFIVPKGQAAGETEFFFTTAAASELQGDAIPKGPANLANYSDPNAGAEFVILTHRGLEASATRYALYRDTNTVNSYDSRLYYIEDIYDEFSYGSRTPLAVKRFIRAALDNWNTRPQYVLLWGKGRENLRVHSTGVVPTWGRPCSDIEFGCNFTPNATNINPEVAIGRVNVKNDAEGDAYLRKVDEYEHTPFELWMKRAIHLGGGTTSGEQNAIAGQLEGKHEPIFEGSPFGGQVIYYQKESNAVVDDATTNDVRDLINEGVGLIQLFGHSSANVFELAMEEASNYQNFGRYPFLIANGCYAGNFSENTSTYGERFVLEPGRGSIGYLALATAGYIYPLGEYTRHFYEVGYRDSIGLPVGDVIAETIRRYYPQNYSPPQANQARENNLQCDPAIRLYYPDGPDLAIDESSISFTPENFSSSIDSVQINVVTRNQGLTFEDSFALRVQQTMLSNGETIDYGYKMFAPILFEDTLRMMLPVGDNQAPGLNNFDVFVDARDTLDEAREDNNRVIVEYLVADELAVPLLPVEFAIVNQSQIELVAGTYAVSNEQFQYEFEIDTSHTFNSPLKQNSGPITGTAVEARWQLPFSLADSVVYYWRVRLVNEEPRWGTSSFKYIAGPSEGWAQSKPPQFFDNPTEDVEMIEQVQRWQFAPRQVGITASVTPGTITYQIQGVNGTTPNSSQGFIGQLAYAVIDGKTLQPSTLLHPAAGAIDMIKDVSQISKLEDIIDQMKTGDYLLLICRGSMTLDQWPQTVFQALSQIGVTQKLKTIDPNQRFILLGRKGKAVGTATELYQNNALLTTNSGPTPGISLVSTLTSNKSEGEISTLKVGPASDWGTYWWGWQPGNETPGDEVYTELYGERSDGTDSLLFTYNNPATVSIGSIDAEEFPWLRLKAYKQDEQNLTAPQYRHWHVHYTPAPEVLLDPTTPDFAFQADTVQEGEPMMIQFTVRNISEYDMDSLLYRIQVRNADNELIPVLERRGRPLAALQSDTVRFDFNALNLNGDCQLIATVNPDFDQVEQYLFNNIYRRSFHVLTDQVNPLLDVTFDGRRIMDGDIVSPEPLIEIRADDENEFLLLDDPELFEVFFRNTSDPLTSEIPIDDPRIEYIPATSAENQAMIRFRPGALADGTYELQVQSYDKRRNASGDSRYKINFEVINQSTITDIVNYPNPFSTNTRFVYTMTGAERPEVFQILIYTVSGKLIKTIDMLELGEVAVGQHITDYAWDGTDEYGDKLANGLYLYRVNFRMPAGVDLEKRDDQTRQYFKKGWGKMYIMR